jgi:hypothetical protein
MDLQEDLPWSLIAGYWVNRWEAHSYQSAWSVGQKAKVSMFEQITFREPNSDVKFQKMKMFRDIDFTVNGTTGVISAIASGAPDYRKGSLNGSIGFTLNMEVVPTNSNSFTVPGTLDPIIEYVGSVTTGVVPLSLLS